MILSRVDTDLHSHLKACNHFAHGLYDNGLQLRIRASSSFLQAPSQEDICHVFLILDE